VSLKVINNFDDCLEAISAKHFFIQDGENNQPAFIKQNDGQFEVINKTTKDINFLKVDDCLDFEVDTKKCDCIVFNEETFCFIELKTLQSEKTTIKTKRRKKAEEQLKVTINKFADEGLIQNRQREAYVSLTCIKESTLTNIPNISNQEAISDFEMNLDTSLYYKCKKEFN